MQIARIAALALIAVFATAPLASAADDNPLYEYFTVENVTESVRELGGTNIETVNEEGTTYVRFQLANFPFNVALQVCKDRPGCVGLVIGAAFNTGGVKYPLETLNAFNRKLPPVTALSLPDGNVAMWRALISLGGISKKNMTANMGMFISYVPNFVEHLQGQVVASTDSATGRAVPASVAPATLTPQRLTAQQMLEMSKDWAIAQEKAKP
jgi:hypothetical protein